MFFNIDTLDLSALEIPGVLDLFLIMNLIVVAWLLVTFMLPTAYLLAQVTTVLTIAAFIRIWGMPPIDELGMWWYAAPAYIQRSILVGVTIFVVCLYFILRHKRW